MKRRIRLLGLLEKWKELEEETLRQRLIQAQAELRDLIRQRNALEMELEELLGEVERQKNFTAQELIEKLTAKDQLKRLIKNAQQREGEKKKELEGIRERLSAVHKRKRLYETLRGKLLALYQEKKIKALMKELDDLAIMRKAREAKDEN